MAQSAVRFDQARKNYGDQAVLHQGRVCCCGSPRALMQYHARDPMEQSFLKCVESGAHA